MFNFIFSYHLIILNIKNVLFLFYLNTLYNFNNLSLFILIFFFIIFSKTRSVKFVNFSNLFFKKIFLNFYVNYIYFFYFNLFFLLALILIYVNYMYYNTLNYLVLCFFPKFQFINFNFENVLNFDYLNFYFVVLTNFIFLVLYLVFLNLKFKKDFYNINFGVLIFLLLFIEFFIVLTFLTSNFFFFFFFFECSLIPMFLLIQMFGKGLKKKQYASYMLVFFTLLGSIFLLFGIIYLCFTANTFDFKQLSFELLDFDTQMFLFLFFFLGFSVKVPIFPFYS